ncbi:MAG: class I SAM-dependent methyltransferase [Methanobacteriota archaeon]
MTKNYSEWARYYDAMTDPELLKREMPFLLWVFRKYGRKETRKLLDVACGTGRHSIPFAENGLNVTGVDLSPDMLSMAKKKAKKRAFSIDLRTGDMRKLRFDEEFDAIICMNSAFNYMMTDEDAVKAVGGFHKALRPGGVAVIDVMNFVKLMRSFNKRVERKGGRDGIMFESVINHRVEDLPAIFIHDEIGAFWAEGKETKIHEVHRLRMFNYNEMARILSEAGFRRVECFGSFGDRKAATKNAKRLIFVCVK